MQNDAPSRSRRARGVMVALTVICVGLGAVYMVQRNRATTPSNGDDASERPEAPSGPTFLNAGPDVAYTGTTQCARCHETRLTSYLETSHSRSLSVVDPSKEPLPGSYNHPASDLHYRMYEQDGGMRIEESIRLESGASHVLADHPMKYLIGSGNHSRSYLTEIDGFLCEAPTTWYASKKAWSISPGYDRTIHLGFMRPAGPVCLSCHVGRAESLGQSVNRMRLHDAAIGCERCHGPGQIHDDLRSRPDPVPEGPDLTIVDPETLSRDQKMDLCAQCHMDHTLTVANPGKRVTDWRPGQPWNEVQVTYRFEQMSPDMTVVGHVDQIRRSACFEGSGTLTCLTCHNPHGQPPADEAARKVHFNGKCLTCHENCGRTPDDGPGIVPPAGDDCIGCHMPRGDTDIAHIAFTNHRISIPGMVWSPGGKRPALPALEPLGDVSHLSPAVRSRNLGLAYLLLSRRQPWPSQVFVALRKRATELLEEARAAGLREPELEAALARIRMDERKYEEAAELAASALELGKKGVLGSDGHTGCLALLAGIAAREDKPDEAHRLLEQLKTLRRDNSDYIRILDSYLAVSDAENAVAAARALLRVWPNAPETHYRAADAFGLAGDEELRDRHNEIGRKIHIQQSLGKPLAKDEDQDAGR